MIPAREVKKAIREIGALSTRTMIDVARACEIIDMDPRQMRRNCVRWERLQSRGATGDIRVTRVGAAGSAFRLDEEDCWEYRRRRGPVRVAAAPAEPVDAEAPEDDDMAAADRYADELIRREFRIG